MNSIESDGFLIVYELDYKHQNVIFDLLNKNQLAYQYLLEQKYLKVSNNGLVAFQFVGVINTENYVLCVLPKYTNSEELNFNKEVIDIVQIIKVLKKAGSIDSGIPDYKNFTTDVSISQSELSLADSFIRDYLEYGMFKKEKLLLNLDSDGDIDWTTTIELANPIFSNNRPIYFNHYNFNSLFDGYNIITELHKWVVSYCLKKYSLILDYNFSFDEETIKDIDQLGSFSFLENLLRLELSITFKDREISLLRRIILFLSKIQNIKSNNFTLYGTGYFHVIWEKVCSCVFQNQIDKFKDNIPLPVWEGVTTEFVKKESLIPDIISIEKSNRNSLFILDAKYYNIKYLYSPKFDVLNNPGVADVSKQFVYNVIFENASFDKKYNCFLFPNIQDDFFKLAGHISLSIFAGKNIYCILLSPQRLFNAYVNNKLSGWEALSMIEEAIEKYNFEKNIIAHL